MSRRKKPAERFERARVERLWAKQVELDMSTVAFCAAEGLDVATYNRWKGRSADEPPAAPRADASLVDVTALLALPMRSDPGVEVILTDGIRLRLAADFDPAALRRAVEALR